MLLTGRNQVLSTECGSTLRVSLNTNKPEETSSSSYSSSSSSRNSRLGEMPEGRNAGVLILCARWCWRFMLAWLSLLWSRLSSPRLYTLLELLTSES